MCNMALKFTEIFERKNIRQYNYIIQRNKAIKVSLKFSKIVFILF